MEQDKGKESCPLCGGTGEVIKRPVRLMGATYPEDDTWKGDEHFLVSTNFNLANHENANGYPCSRFETATHMLRSIDEDTLTVEACADILDAVHIEYKDRNGTVYSNIFDLVKRKAYIYHLHDFDNVIEFDLDQELSQIKTNDTQFRMAGSNLFSKFQGVRIFVIEDLFTN